MEGEGARKGSWETDTLDTIGFAGLEIVMRAGEGGDTTSTHLVVNDSRVYGRLTDEAITPIYGHGSWVMGIGSTNHQTLVNIGLIADEVRLEQLNRLAIGPTTKSQISRGEGSAAISIHSATIAIVPRHLSIRGSIPNWEDEPEACATPYIRWLAIAFNVSRS